MREVDDDISLVVHEQAQRVARVNPGREGEVFR